MAKSVIRLDHWPYQGGEAAKLIKISKPYSVKGSWFIDALFLSVENNIPKIIQRSFARVYFATSSTLIRKLIHGAAINLDDLVGSIIQCKRQMQNRSP